MVRVGSVWDIVGSAIHDMNYDTWKILCSLCLHPGYWSSHYLTWSTNNDLHACAIILKDDTTVTRVGRKIFQYVTDITDWGWLPVTSQAVLCMSLHNFLLKHLRLIQSNYWLNVSVYRYRGVWVFMSHGIDSTHLTAAQLHSSQVYIM